jgi:hypothetical protein
MTDIETPLGEHRQVNRELSDVGDIPPEFARLLTVGARLRQSPRHQSGQHADGVEQVALQR